MTDQVPDLKLPESSQSNAIALMQNSNLDLNTHRHDGPLGLLYHKLIVDDIYENLLSFEDSIKQVEEWLQESSIPNKINIHRAIDLLKNDKQNNYDDKNKISVEELLPRITNIVKDYDISGRDLFLTVLGEIVELGACSQGRTTRLLSFYIPART